MDAEKIRAALSELGDARSTWQKTVRLRGFAEREQLLINEAVATVEALFLAAIMESPTKHRYIALKKLADFEPVACNVLYGYKEEFHAASDWQE